MLHSWRFNRERSGVRAMYRTHLYSAILTHFHAFPTLQRFVRTVWAVRCGGCMLMHMFVNRLAIFQRCAAVRSSRMRVVCPAPTTPTTTSPTRSVCGRSRSPRDTPSRYTSTRSRYVSSYILSSLRKDPVSHFSVYSRNMFYMTCILEMHWMSWNHTA